MGKKAVSNLDRVLKSRNITLPTKVCIIKAMVFTVVMYRCESWTIKLSAKGLMLSKCVAGEDSWESLGQEGNQTYLWCRCFFFPVTCQHLKKLGLEPPPHASCYALVLSNTHCIQQALFLCDIRPSGPPSVLFCFVFFNLFILIGG